MFGLLDCSYGRGVLTGENARVINGEANVVPGDEGGTDSEMPG
jgi:hypothetical protein